MPQQKLLSFTISDRRLALPLEAVNRVIPLPLLAPPIGAPYFVEGFFDYLGAPLAAIRLERLLGLPESHLGLYSPLLVLAGTERGLALHVGKADGITNADLSQVQPIPDNETLNGCVFGRFSDQAETVYLLDKGRLLLAAEREKLDAHQIMVEGRLEALHGDPVHVS
jgi:chemotaxis signal transduction protein